MPKGVKKEETKGGKLHLIKSSDEKMHLWKPTKVGETVEGKLIRISESQFGKVLRIRTKKGVQSVPVSTFLEEIDWEEFANEIIRFTFKGVAGRNMKLFDVFHIKPEEELPF